MKIVSAAEYDGMDSRVAMIQALIPLGLMKVQEDLEREVIALVGERYSRNGDRRGARYGSNPGTVRIDGQVIPVRVPRVRDEAGEIPLESYQRLHRGVQSE